MNWLGWSATKRPRSGPSYRSEDIQAGTVRIGNESCRRRNRHVGPLVGNIVGGVGNLAQSLVFSPYSRSQETQADEVGQEIAAKAGWDPAGLPAFLNTLGREEALLSDGPGDPVSLIHIRLPRIG